MKLRKKQIKVRKNFFIPLWRIPIFYRGIFDFLGGEGSELSECIGGIGRVTAVGTHDLCVRCIKCYSVVGFNGDGRTDRASLQPLLDNGRPTFR